MLSTPGINPDPKEVVSIFVHAENNIARSIRKANALLWDLNTLTDLYKKRENLFGSKVVIQL